MSAKDVAGVNKDVANLALSEGKEDGGSDEYFPKLGDGFYKQPCPYTATPDSSKPGYSEAPGQSFNVRRGPKYSSNKKKAPSLHAFYKLQVADIFRTPLKVTKIGQKVSWDHPTEWPCHKEDTVAPPASEEVSAGGCPRTLVLNYMIPNYEPPLMSKKVDGPGFCVVNIFTLSAEGRAELEAQETPAAKLLKNFFTKLRQYHGRFKAIPTVMNVDKISFGMVARKALSVGNSKPFMTGPTCHSFFIPKDRSYFEIDLDFHRYAFAGVKALSAMMPQHPQIVMKLGFVVQGNDDDELPEQMLGCVQLNHLDFNNGREVDFREIAPRKTQASRGSVSSRGSKEKN